MTIERLFAAFSYFTRRSPFEKSQRAFLILKIMKNKLDLIKDEIREIQSVASRHTRGTDEHEYLIRDLENIFGICDFIIARIEEPKSEYSDFDREMLRLGDFKTAIEKAATKETNEKTT